MCTVLYLKHWKVVYIGFVEDTGLCMNSDDGGVILRAVVIFFSVGY